MPKKKLNPEQLTPTFWYLASPYSDPFKSTRQARHDLVSKAAAMFGKRQLRVLSPILHWHNTAEEYDLPKSYDFWRGMDKMLIRQSCGIVVLQLQNWELSTGVSHEIGYAEGLGKPVYYLSEKDTLSDFLQINFGITL